MRFIKLAFFVVLLDISIAIGIFLGLILLPFSISYYFVAAYRRRPKCAMCVRRSKELDEMDVCPSCQERLDTLIEAIVEGQEEQEGGNWLVMDIQYAEMETKLPLETDLYVDEEGMPYVNSNRGYYLQVGHDGWAIM